MTILTLTKTFLKGYFTALWFAVWSGVCVLIGAAWAFAAITAALEANGIHVIREIARVVGL